MKKRKIKRWFAVLLIFSLVFGSVSSLKWEANATSGDPYEQRKEAKKNKRDAQQILDALETSKSNIQKYVEELDGELTEVQAWITGLGREQVRLESDIEQKKAELEAAKLEEAKRYSDMCNRVKLVYESGNQRYLDVLLNAASMADILNQTEYVEKVSEYDHNILNQLVKARRAVADAENKLEKDLAANEALQKDMNEQKEVLETLLEAKNKEIASYNATIQEQQALVAEWAEQERIADEIIAAMEAEAAENGGAGGTGGAVYYTGGQFTWPVPGHTRITSPFGPRSAPTAGASTNHQGIDIACPNGATVVAAASGKVIIAQYSPASGNYMAIDHGNGLTTIYLHNSSLVAKVGDIVNAGVTIAYAGSTGISSGPHLHFGVRANGQYVDPMPYLGTPSAS